MRTSAAAHVLFRPCCGSSTTMRALREQWVHIAVYSFRVIVVEDGNRTTQLVLPFERFPYEGDVVELPDSCRSRSAT